MVNPPHRRRTAVEEAALCDHRKSERDVMGDSETPRLPGCRHSLPMSTRWNAYIQAADAQVTTSSPALAVPEQRNVHLVSRELRSTASQSTSRAAMTGLNLESALTSTPANEDQQKAADRRTMRHVRERGLSRKAAAVHSPELYIDVPKDDDGVPLPSPVFTGDHNDHAMTDAPDSGAQQVPHQAPGTSNADLLADTWLPPSLPPALFPSTAATPPAPWTSTASARTPPVPGANLEQVVCGSEAPPLRDFQRDKRLDPTGCR